MKHNNIFSLCFILVAVVLWGSCQKTAPNIFTMFKGVSLTLDSLSIPHSAGYYNKINAGDSVVFNFTMESAHTDMYQVALYQIGAAIPFLKIPITDPSQRRKFSYTYEMGEFTGSVGLNTYRIFAYDSAGVYIGDGYRTIVLDVTPDYTFLPNRRLYFPDSADGQNDCYLSLTDGKTYNYTTGATNSAKIDLGLYKTVEYGSNDTRTENTYIYSLATDPLPFDVYDISNWEKRETLFASTQKNQASNFIRNYTSGEKIKSYAKGRKPNSSNVTKPIVLGDVIPFLMPEGNYGLMLVNAITKDGDGREYMDVSIKYKN